MNCTRTLTLSALLVPVLCASLATGDKPAYHPEAGSKLSRVWSIKQDMTLDDMQMTMNGQPFPMDLNMEMDMSMQMDIGVTDQLLSMRAEGPKVLRRSFDKLGSTGSFSVEMAMMPDGGMEQSMDASSELEGKTVDFTWNEETSEYETAYHESEGDAKLLESLDEDMDVRGLLPNKEVAEGDSWDVDVKKLRALLMPGGDLGIRPNETGDNEMAGMLPGMDSGMGNMADMLGDLLEGEAKAEYKGMQELDGGKYGVIHLTVKISSANDMSDKLTDALDKMPEGVEATIDHVDIEFSIEAEGTILWDLAGGHVHSLELSGKTTISIDTAMQITTQGQSMGIEQSMSMSGTSTTKLEVSKN